MKTVTYLLKAYAVGVLLRAFIISMAKEAREIAGEEA